MRRKRTTLILIGIGALGVVFALAFGVHDVLPGQLLLWTVSIALVLAFAHSWRETKRFVALLFVSVGGMFSLGFLAHALGALAEVSADLASVSRVLGFLAVLLFFVAVFLGWAGILVGGVGALLLRVFGKD